ncbi:hypothetical protein J6590_023362 [Homalodisca vitripennis]|nr:hypothetical protein J6590_023362 [Homalodisca vitripennis]
MIPSWPRSGGAGKGEPTRPPLPPMYLSPFNPLPPIGELPISLLCSPFLSNGGKILSIFMITTPILVKSAPSFESYVGIDKGERNVRGRNIVNAASYSRNPVSRSHQIFNVMLNNIIAPKFGRADTAWFKFKGGFESILRDNIAFNHLPLMD